MKSNILLKYIPVKMVAYLPYEKKQNLLNPYSSFLDTDFSSCSLSKHLINIL